MESLRPNLFRTKRLQRSAIAACCLLLWVLILAFEARAGSIIREVYSGIPGVSVSDLTNNPAYPGSPTSVQVITDFFEAPLNEADNYGQRMRGYLTAPVSGNYTFWISSDDGSTLYLSTDESTANKRVVASVASWTNSRQWTKEPNQTSALVPLTAGKRYYIEALMKEGGGGDNLAVRWQLPDGTIEEPIPASRIEGEIKPPVIAKQPQNVTAVEGGAATFTLTLENLGTVNFRWFRNSQPIPGGTNQSLLLQNLQLTDSGARFYCQASNSIGSTNSTEAVLTVTPDQTAPAVLGATASGEGNIVSLLFSEPVDVASATTAGNYSINQGVQVNSARVDAEGRTVILVTSALTLGNTYQVTVNGVRDRATNPNTIVANTRANFTYDYTPLDVSQIRGTSEKPGPSSRRSGLAISEIMYHPAADPAGRNLQFIELYNSNDWPEDISGYRLSGPWDYVFPTNTTISTLGYLVVAAVPADVKAAYGLSTVLGGITNGLPNDSATITLKNKRGAIMADATYGSKAPYPVAPDGTGHSLVMARPSYGGNDPRAWAQSLRLGGSPGAAEPSTLPTYRTVLINEYLAHTDPPDTDYIELFNYGSAALNLAGCILSDDAATNRYVIPAGISIPAKGFAVFTQEQLGFALNAAGESLFFRAPDGTVIDAVRFDAQENGVSSGRYPDGAPEFYRLAGKTPGTPNSRIRNSAIVINELMYAPISGNSDDEYVELFNTGADALDVTGWRLNGGISYTFPTKTTIPGGTYFVVARNAERMRTNYPSLTAPQLFGNFSGKLSKSGERLVLEMPDEVASTNLNGVITTNKIHIAVDEVTYSPSGRWGTWAASGGSSLELTDSHGNRRRASNWADSDESAKSAWTTVEFSGVLDNGNGNADELQFFIQEAGECLVDDIQVISAGLNIVKNSGFETGFTDWVAQGNHSASTVEAGGLNGGNALHVRALGRGDPGANRIRTTLKSSIASGTTATVRAKVRWLKGHPELLFRLHGNWLEAVGKMSVPANLGTPGAPNSTRIANAGPAVYDATHFPALPSATQPVTVRARISDPDGVANVVLKYRLDPSTNWVSVLMNYNGAGLYSVAVPGQAAGASVAFYIQATDAATPTATSLFPNDAPNRECVIRWGEPQPPGNLGSYRIWITKKVQDQWAKRLKLDNGDLDATFVYNNDRVVYNMGTLYSGSPWVSPGYDSPVGGLCGYILHFYDDEPFLGSTDFVMDWPIRDGTLQLEQMAYWIGAQIGLPYNYRRFVNLYVNGNKRGQIYEDAQQPGSEMVGGWFPNDSNGDLFKIEDWFEFDDNAAMEFNVDATLQNFTTTGNAKKLARYRWNWRKRMTDTPNDYASLFGLVDAVTAPAAQLQKAVEATLDMDEWFGVQAVEKTVGNWDSFGYNRGKNMFAYKPANGKWNLLIWDMDFVMSAGADAASSANIFNSGEPATSSLFNQPFSRRAYLRRLQNIIDGPLDPAKMNPVMDARYAALTRAQTMATDPSGGKAYVAERRNTIRTAIGTANSIPFRITSNNGADFSTNKNLITLTGTSPINVKTIEINRVSYPLIWTSITNWSVVLPITARANSLVFTAYDSFGQLLGTNSAALNITYTGTLERPQDFLAINEVMYNSVAPNASYIELYNRSTTTTYDLSNWRLDGADFTFPDGTLFAPGTYLVIANNRVAFAAAYGAGIPVVGEFKGKLQNGGETLKLVIPGTTANSDVLVDAVRYDNAAPWPMVANGQGPSLQLIDPSRDNSRPGNWASSATNAAVRYTPGAVNSVKSSLPEFPTVWINEVLPANTGGLMDGTGALEPWIELYNSGTNTVDLSAYYLANNYTNLTQWQFPAGSSIAAGQFLLVFADGEANQTTATEWHTNFRLTPGTGSLAFSRLQIAQPAVMDFLNYKFLSAGRAYGSYPDGQATDRQLFDYPTPANANNPVYAPVQVTINEWMAGNSTFMADPADGHFDDWFELYNPSTNAVDLSFYRLSNTVTNTSKFVIPNGTVIPAEGHLLVWADNDSSQNSPTNADLHANFKLSLAGETIALYGPDDKLVDSVTFGPQTNDLSQGRFPDGAPAPYYVMEQPSPRLPNRLSGGNRTPIFNPIADLTVNEGVLVSFRATATDPDAGQIITYSLGAGSPAAATIDAQTGQFNWTPGENDGPGTIAVTLRATDNGTPALTGALRVTINVREVNTPPILPVLPDQTIAEGRLFTFGVVARDDDFPPQFLSYSLASGAPEGAQINLATGVISWTPTETQGGSSYTLTVQVADNGTPVQSASGTLKITVTKVNSLPQVAPVLTQTVEEGTLLRFSVNAVDSDLPKQALTFAFDGVVPGGMVIDPATGVLTWTPAPNQVPSTNSITVRVTDDGVPSQSSTVNFLLIGTRPNQPPVLTHIDKQTINEGERFSLTLNATDADIGQTLTYSFEPGAPTGVNLDSATGVLTWTPTEEQGPGTNQIGVTVFDNGTPRKSATQFFVIEVREVNTPPQFTGVAEQTMPPGGTAIVNLRAIDSDLPTNHLSFSLVGAAPAGVTLDPQSGAFIWRIPANTPLGTNNFLVRVTDDGSPSLSSTGTVQIVVGPATPWRFVSVTGTSSSSTLYIYLDGPGDLYLDNLVLVAGTNLATGPNLLTNGDFESSLATGWTVSANLSSSVLSTNVKQSGKASLHVISSAAGTTRDSSIYQVINPALTANATYTLGYWYSPGSNATTLTIRLSGNGIVSTNLIAPVANTPPIIAAMATQYVRAGSAISFDAVATDPDPGQSVRFSLVTNPSGSAIDATSGRFTWSTSGSQAPGYYPVQVQATDTGVPPLSATASFGIVVEPGVSIPLELTYSLSTDRGTITISWLTVSGKHYRLEYGDAANGPWQTLTEPVGNGGLKSVADVTTRTARYFRLLQLD